MATIIIDLTLVCDSFAFLELCGLSWAIMYRKKADDDDVFVKHPGLPNGYAMEAQT